MITRILKRAALTALAALNIAALLSMPAHAAGSGRRLQASPASVAEGFYSILGLQAGQPIATNVFIEPTDGVFIVVNWADIEPKPGGYSYAQLDRATSLAVQNGKKIILAVKSGNNAPGWIYKAPYGARSSAFIFSIHGGAGACQNVNIPWPWDQEYQHLFKSMIQALANHLKSQPAVYARLTAVKITGLNTDTEELHLPSSDGTPGPVCTQSNAELAWQQVGYTPNKIISAWGVIASAFANAFPSQLLQQAVLVNGDFPLISNSGQILTSPFDPAWVDIKQAIVNEAVKAFPGRFAMNTTGLTAYPQPTILQTYAQQGTVIGFQSNEFLGIAGGAGCDAVDYFHTPQPCTAATYKSLVMNGVNSNGWWFEVWPPNVQQFPSDVVQADQALHALHP